MKNKNVKKITHIIFIIFLILFIINLLSSCGFASDTMKGIYTTPEGATNINTRAGKILGNVIAFGTAAGVIMIAVIGLKYIVSSPEGKADLKKQMVPYFIGALLITSASTVVGIIASVANTLN